MHHLHISRVVAAVVVVFVLAVALAAGVLWNAPRSSAGGNVIVNVDTTGSGTSLVLDSSGNPVVSYYDPFDRDLRILHCNNPNCSSPNSITLPDTAGDVGSFSSLALDANGYPVVSYFDDSNDDLKIMHCNDPNCAGGDESITSPDTVGSVGEWTSLALDADGYPVVSYSCKFNCSDLKIMHCNDANCAGGDESITSPWTGNITSLVLNGSGNPVVSFRVGGDLALLTCGDPTCGPGFVVTIHDASAPCCVTYSSLVLDSNGNPVVAYRAGTKDVKIMHCNDPSCSGSDESITAPHTSGDLGAYLSMALDASGYPVVSYLCGNSCLWLYVMHCNDANCAGSNEVISRPDPGPNVGIGTSLALDAIGNPVVSYTSSPTGVLRILHCGDPYCGAGPTPTPTPTPTATPPPTGDPGFIQGDNNCDGKIQATDALAGLQKVAGLPVNQQPDCPALGGALPAAAPASDPPDLFGDVDCDNDVDAVDALKILQSVAAIAFTQNEPCTDIGEPF